MQDIMAKQNSNKCAHAIYCLHTQLPTLALYTCSWQNIKDSLHFVVGCMADKCVIEGQAYQEHQKRFNVVENAPKLFRGRQGVGCIL